MGKTRQVQIEYIWLDGNNSIRSKTKVCHVDPTEGDDFELPAWNYDGSSTYQAFQEQSEIMLYPIKKYSYPVDHKFHYKYIAVCKTSASDCSLTIAETIFKNAPENKPMFGLEQEFFIQDHKTGKPLGWPITGEPRAVGDYYCSVGSRLAFGRDYLQECLEMMLDIKLPVTGMNFEVAPGQAEFQVCDIGIDAAHHMTMLRYILALVGEKYDYSVDYRAKPIEGNWAGSGCHINFSTETIRNPGGYDEIMKCMKYLADTHADTLKFYGKGNEKRLTGKNETSSMTEFTYDVANRGTSVRIPTDTFEEKCGYFEDRRPAANIDPYLATANLYKVCCLDHKALGSKPSKNVK